MKLKILNTEYEVKETDINTLRKEAELEDDNGFFYGAVHFPTQRIFLNKDLTLHVLKKTLRHELCHAFLFESGTNLETITEEALCDFVGAFGEEICNLCNSYFNQKEPKGKEEYKLTKTDSPTIAIPYPYSAPVIPYNPYVPYSPSVTQPHIYCKGD